MANAPSKVAPKKGAPKKAVKAAPKTAAKAAPKQAVKRAMPSVSPLRGTSVEAFVASKMVGWQADAARQILALFARVAPEGAVIMKWGHPILERGGPVAFVKPAKAHLTLGFWRGAELADPKGVLEGGDRMKHVKLRSASLDVPLLEGFVRAAVRMNVEKGDPSRR